MFMSGHTSIFIATLTMSSETLLGGESWDAVSTVTQ